MIDFLLADIFALLAPLLGRAQTYNLSFVSRRLRQIIGFVSKDDMLSYSMRDRNLILFQDYLNRFPVFPLHFSAELGRTGSLALINVAYQKLTLSMVDYFDFHVAQGLLLAQHHELFKQAHILPIAHKEIVCKYFDNWTNIQCSNQLLGAYLALLDHEEVFPTRMANIFRAAPSMRDVFL